MANFYLYENECSDGESQAACRLQSMQQKDSGCHKRVLRSTWSRASQAIRSTASLTAIVLTCICSLSSAASDQLPAGFRQISSEVALAAVPIGLFPGFLLLQGLDRWSGYGPAKITYVATLFVITCNGKVHEAKVGFSTESYQGALRELEDAKQTERLKAVSSEEIEHDKQVMSLARATCNLQSSNSRSNAEVVIAEANDEVVGVIARTIQSKGELRNAWLHSIPIKREPIRNADGRSLPLAGGKFLMRTVVDTDRPTSKSQVNVNCSAGTIRTLESVQYADNGSVLSATHATNSPRPQETLVSGSIGESIAKFLCSK
jgi:hypothetical protein